MPYQVIEGGRIAVKAWIDGVHVDHNTLQQVRNTVALPFVSNAALMPDCHYGIGATVGSVVATHRAVIPAAVGVDIGCGMMALQTSLKLSDLPDSLADLRSRIERAVPHGGPGPSGGWQNGVPNSVNNRWQRLEAGHKRIVEKRPDIGRAATVTQLGTLGGGNHFIEVCGDEDGLVWVMLHSGSRGIGNRIGTEFITEAREMLLRRKSGVHVPDKDLAWLEEGEQQFDDYVEAVHWAQDFAMENRKAMMERVLHVMHEILPPFTLTKQAVNCHHNYVAKEHHFGQDVLVTRKGAVRAGKDELGIIPGSMGAKSFIVRGLGNEDSLCSCSHGAGRVMSRSQAKKLITIEDHERATAGVECRKDAGVLDESPDAYKDIDTVMAAQTDLVEIVHTLKQVLCVKG